MSGWADKKLRRSPYVRRIHYLESAGRAGNNSWKSALTMCKSVNQDLRFAYTVIMNCVSVAPERPSVIGRRNKNDWLRSNECLELGQSDRRRKIARPQWRSVGDLSGLNRLHLQIPDKWPLTNQITVFRKGRITWIILNFFFNFLFFFSLPNFQGKQFFHFEYPAH